ncbi:Helix-turn-helix domain-containing protein [Paenibacillus sp. UNC496MF]|uniref:response regulator n=1 Tax=Paenibacillus sp. UNC496MF TaxID=1502753 RepID=UPI0008F34AA9|nr:response regulator [Paenibacillus sp. UNC496MF]SFI98930.1 Helix-turn-helix domain-containing protein [Paenibacillus sp. UNC496MF]
MYRLLIVDDEKVIRDGLSAWDWERCGIEVAGCCAHGLEALKFISTSPVDIVMTDIRMPFMDGIALMDALNRRYPFIKLIVLSGHGDFAYARKATQYGAVDYLLKPVPFAELPKTIGRLKERLDEQRQHEERLKVLTRKALQLTKVLRDDFLARLFEGPLSCEALEQGGAEGEVLLEAGRYTAAVLVLDRIAVRRQRTSEKERKLIAFSLDNMLSDLWDARQHGYHLVDKSSLEVFLLAKDGGRQLLTDIAGHLHRYIGLFKSTFSLGIGVTVGSPYAIWQSMLAARSALAGNAEEGAVKTGAVPREETGLRGQLDRPPEEDDAPEADAAEPGSRDSIILVEAKRYMKANYGRSLTLKEVADHVFISTGHLSALFRHAGERFLKVLTAVRMEKAKELMLDNGYKVYEIVELVGYSDPAYFTEVFKKHTGKTPNEYRGKLKQPR